MKLPMLFILAVSLLPSTSQSASLTSCDEAGLRAAINAGGSITFACNGRISLTQTLQVSKDVVLDGSGYEVVISGGNAVRVFSVASGIKLTLINLTIADGRQRGTNGTFSSVNGEPASGAAIFNLEGVVSLFGCVVTNNVVTGGDGSTRGTGGSARGGAIFNSGGALQISNCLFLANTVIGGTGGPPNFSAGGDGGDALGGAIFTQMGSLDVSASSLSFNSATGGLAGGISGSAGYGSAGSGYGGAIHSTGGSVTLADCRLNSNYAVGNSLPWNGTAVGKGLGGGLRIESGSLRAWKTTFTNNLALGGSGQRFGTIGEGWGGAICSDGIIEVNDCAFVGNRATAGNSGGLGGSGKGGAISANGLSQISGATFLSNSAVGGNGNPVGFGSGQSYGGSGSGGAIHASATFAMTNSTLAANFSRGGNGVALAGGPGAGGAIYCTSSTGVLVNVTLTANSALGGSSALGGPTGESLGGGIYSTNGMVEIGNAILSGSAGSNCLCQLMDLGGNLSSDGSCNFSSGLNNVDPVLGPLGDYGGPTMTMALLEGSPAIGGGVDGIAPTEDQRGHTRPFGAHVDSGAFESSFFLIRGHVNHYRGPGLRVFAGTASSSVQPDGTFKIFASHAGSYEVAPDKTKIVSLPETRTVVVGPDQFGVDFDSYPLNGFWIENSSNQRARVVFGGTNGQKERIEISSDLKNWEPYATNTVGVNNLFEFYRNTAGSTADQTYFRGVRLD